MFLSHRDDEFTSVSLLSFVLVCLLCLELGSVWGTLPPPAGGRWNCSHISAFSPGKTNVDPQREKRAKTRINDEMLNEPPPRFDLFMCLPL